MPEIELINTATFVVLLFVIWLLASQRGLIRRVFGKWQFVRAVLEGLLMLAMAYAAQETFSILANAPHLDEFETFFRFAANIVVYIGYGGMLGRITEGGLFYRKARKEDWKLSKLTQGAIYGAALFFTLSIFLIRNNITPAEVYVWAGGAAAIVAFIMQQTLSDLFSGLAVSAERPFKLGDWLRLSDGTEGQVIDINWRATHLRAWDKTTLVIPNSKLAQDSFINLHGRDHPFAPWYIVKISGDHDPARIKALLEQATGACTYPMPTPAPVIRLMNAEKSPYEYMVWMHFEDYPTMFAGREELYRNIDSTLRAEGIAIAADIQEVKLSGSLSDQ